MEKTNIHPTQKSTLPEKKFQAGAISASVWENPGEKDGKAFSYKSISIQRAYKDTDGSWKHTASFRSADLPKLSLVAQKAYDYIVTSQQEVSAQ